MRISDWSSDVCSSDLQQRQDVLLALVRLGEHRGRCLRQDLRLGEVGRLGREVRILDAAARIGQVRGVRRQVVDHRGQDRKSVVEGKSVSVRVDLGGRRIIKKTIRKTVNNKLIQ